VPFDPRDYFDHAFDAFIRREVDLITSGVSERSLCARLMLQMESAKRRFDLGQYTVDVDYNRMGRQSVKYMMGRRGPVRIESDLLVHRRGVPENLIALEMKKSKANRALKDDDRERLEILTLPVRRARNEVFPLNGPLPPEHASGYELGIFLILNKDARLFRIEEYRRGRLVRPQETRRF
jgi:hypothetical protein